MGIKEALLLSLGLFHSETWHLRWDGQHGGPDEKTLLLGDGLGLCYRGGALPFHYSDSCKDFPECIEN